MWTKAVLQYLRSVLAIHTYIATYVCRALYDNAQIQLQLQEYCLPLACVCMQCAHYVYLLYYSYVCIQLVGMPRYRIFYVICHGQLCHDMSYVTT